LEFLDDLVEHGHSISCSLFAASFMTLRHDKHVPGDGAVAEVCLCHSSAALAPNAALE
jgi:hypothetical protein